MYPELFRIGTFPITTYGIWLALGMLAALFAASRLAARDGLPGERIYDLGLWVLVGGLVGSKLLMVIVEPGVQVFTFDFLRSGGVYYGGLIGGFLAAVILIRFYKLPFWKVSDALAAGLALGQAFGRQGCFAAGCCWGKATTLPWGVHFTEAGHEYTGVPIIGPDNTDLYLQPTQLYESFAMLAVFAFLVYLHRHKKFDGQVLIAYGILYSIIRFSIEFVRDDPRGDLWGLTTMTGLSTSQLVSIVVAIVAIVLMIVRLRSAKGTKRFQKVIEETPSLSLILTEPDAGKRLDAYLAENIDGWSRSRLQRLVENEDALVNDRAVKPSYRLREGDTVEIDLVEAPAARFEPEDIPLDIVYEDEHLAVINKPAGMVVHPGAGVQSGTLANAIAWHFGSAPTASAGGQKVDPESTNWPPTHAGGSDRVGIVHRLDKDTSGLIVVAKSDEIHEALSEQFRERLVYKSYVALVHGPTEQNSGKIEAAIGRNKHNRLRMKVAGHGRSALTLWKVRQRFTKFTLLDVEIKTGRTHQIRVHMGYINHPVVGDEIYNEGRDNTIADIHVRNAVVTIRRFFLHAEKLSFTHPKTGERMEFTQELPPELINFLNIL